MPVTEITYKITPPSHNNDTSIHKMTPSNPIVTQNYYHTSSYESKYTNGTTNANIYHREQSRSRDSSPTSVSVDRRRSPSPINGSISSSIGHLPSSTYQDQSQRNSSSSSSSTFTSRPEYHNVSHTVTNSPRTLDSTYRTHNLI
jgi:hypothetical protein